MTRLGTFLYDHFSVLVPPTHPIALYVEDKNYKRYQADLALFFERICQKLYEQNLTLKDVQKATLMKLREESWTYALADDAELSEKNEFTAALSETLRDIAPSAYEYVHALTDFVIDYGILRDVMPNTLVDSYTVSLWIGLNLRVIAGLETTSEIPIVETG